ncbi:stalk domain-containing protein [Lysinibacillus sp. NPDC097231]|uniref:stalk domain-containing protein n=1 Tax=Lysinibacillus sp. NPDC097231 TaxID=3364142 RepID=UPI0037F858D1
MKKLFFAFILLFSLVSPTFAHASSSSLVLKINNKEVSSKLSPFISDGTTYVPINEIAKHMGGGPRTENNKVIIEVSGLTFVIVTANESKALIYDSQLASRDKERQVPLKTQDVDGKTANVNAKAIYKNGQLFVPLEFISSHDGLGYYVETVESDSQTIIYVGEVPEDVADPIKKTGYATKETIVVPSPGDFRNITSIVKNQQVYIARAQGEWYKIAVGKHYGFVKKDAVEIGKSPATGKMYPDGWFAPTLKSAWSKDPQVNYSTLENELGFRKGGIVYHIYGGKAIQVLDSGSDSYEVGISFFGWENKTLEQSYRIPIVAKELFKLYFGNDYMKVWNYFDKNDIPENFTANGRKVKAQFVEADGSLYLIVGRKK